MSPIQIRQSDLASFAYCAQQVKLKRLAKSEGWREPNLSATLRGTVLHFAFETLQRLHHEGREDALQVAQATFEYFWDPSHITELDGIDAPVDEWIGYDTWGGLLQRSLNSLREAYAWLLKDKSVLLGLEHSFTVPLTIDGEEHTLHGTVDRLNLRMVSGRPVIGIDDLKGLALDTPLATPGGWSTIGAIRAGDEVFGKNGKPTRVTFKTGIKEMKCYRVVFDDGTSIVCDHEHVWETTTGKSSDRYITATRGVEEIRSTLRGKNEQLQHRIFQPEPLDLPTVPLPIDPYVLGVWLGDGTAISGSITEGAVDSPIRDEIVSRGYVVNDWKPKRSSTVLWHLAGFRTELRLAGLLGHKSIPAIYMRASIVQRLDLLRGLMDTDGTWNRLRHQAVFNSTDKAQAANVRELALSLGERAIISEFMAHGFGLDVTAYAVSWTPLRFNPFLLPRKRDLVRVPAKGLKANRRMIVSVEDAPSVPTACIGVAAEDSIYLAGDQMVPTHNCYRQEKWRLDWEPQWTIYSYASLQPGFWTPFYQDDAIADGFADVVDRLAARGQSITAVPAGNTEVLPRRGRLLWAWDGFKVKDTGWRTEAHYARMRAHVREYVKAVRGDMYPLTVNGHVCGYCAFGKGIAQPDGTYHQVCGDAPLPAIQEGIQ